MATKKLTQTKNTIKKLTPRQDFLRRVCEASKRANVENPKLEVLVRRLAVELWNMGPRSHFLAEAACNRELTERETKRDEEMDARVVAIGKELGLKAYRQGDPRGWTIRVEVPQDLADCWDGISTGCG